MAETPCFRVLAHGHSTGEDTRMLGIHPEAKFSESTRKMALAFLFTQKLLSSQRHRDRLSSLILYDRIGVPCLHFPHAPKMGAKQDPHWQDFLNHRMFPVRRITKKKHIKSLSLFCIHLFTTTISVPEPIKNIEG